ncbi:hypothetical protein F383_24272 [Gossypium arboreum]|uniref:Uncharacterized protein n=1 Tax=Gossypium arboreum TaxID=29729 RepID=A0A0B0P4P8_GOSAR|nr:hypothetical protein F383_24272 [Gossypium arboreum]
MALFCPHECVAGRVTQVSSYLKLSTSQDTIVCLTSNAHRAKDTDVSLGCVSNTA